MWYHIVDNNLYFTIKVKANAKETKIVGLQGKMLKVMIKSPPVDGKANQELIKFFMRFFKLLRNQIQLVSGENSPVKRLKVVFNSNVRHFIANIGI